MTRQWQESGFDGAGTPPSLLFGGDYNPEQWPRAVWDEDMALMCEAGVNMVSLGVFSWSRIEPREGEYDFDWLDEAMDLLAANEIGVALATPTASPPPWFSLAHPDALPVRADGVRLIHGSRDTYCVSAPDYRAACVRIARALGERYAGHPALRLWHVHNEYGTWCHCEPTEDAFRRWLTERYGDLDALNDAWTTAHWGQLYSHWDQITSPRATQYLANPAQCLDFRRFQSDEMLAAFKEQKAVLRELTPTIPVTTNFVFGDWVPVNHAAWSTEVDLVAIDHYPNDPGCAAEEQTARYADLARSWAAGDPWLLIESAANLVHAGGRAYAKTGGRMTRHSLSHVARGSRGAMFFQWRAPSGGAERWHGALLPHSGPDTRAFEEAAALGATLDRLAEIQGSRVLAEVAILADVESSWALAQPGMPTGDLVYEAALAQAHRVAGRAGYTVDFAAPGADLSGYRLVLVPSLYLVSEADAARLAAYVHGGGHVVVSCFSGVADEHGRIRSGGYTGAFAELLGVRVTELHPLAPQARVSLGGGLDGTLWSEEVRLTGAQTVTAYASGPLSGLPAITRHEYGDGVARYVSTVLDDRGYGEVLVAAAREAEPAMVLPYRPHGIEAVRRSDGVRSWLFLLNHSTEPVEVPGAEGVDLLSRRKARGTLRLGAGGAAVLRES